jgi:hypothetical protein
MSTSSSSSPPPPLPLPLPPPSTTTTQKHDSKRSDTDVIIRHYCNKLIKNHDKPGDMGPNLDANTQLSIDRCKQILQTVSPSLPLSIAEKETLRADLDISTNKFYKAIQNNGKTHKQLIIPPTNPT